MNEYDRVRGEWQSVAAGWRRWEPLLQSFTWPIALRMAGAAGIAAGQRVLDVGCGIGDPTLQVAVLVGPHGRVVGIDVAEDMVATARDRAAALGLAHVEFRAADVLSEPFAPESFDAVLGRWSLNYVADVPGALARLRAALVPGGRIALAAWAPPAVNPWITVPMDATARIRPLPPVDPAAPGGFHLSEDGALARALVGAGFQAVGQERVQLSLFARDPAEYWTMMGDVEGPLAPLLAKLSAEERARVARDVADGIARYRVGDVYRIPAQAQLAWGRV
ncbi:MAG TPA: methyltransferase domain-containing protein [Candidatus Binatia bacterium]|jgi:ubiquinone/menaquinone biosynthesis C-methylase UbiE|nr:methyltransferase domain-containing protein [Candidatus Binatia bacterium]